MEELTLGEFPQITKDEWLNLAAKQLKQDDVTSILGWKADEALNIEPYYDSEDLENLQYLEEFFGKVPSFKWKLYEEVEVKDEKISNEQALAALAGGCDGVVFRISKPLDQKTLLENILMDICDISIINDMDTELSISDAHGFTLSQHAASDLTPESGSAQVAQIIQIIKNAEDKKHVHRTASSDFFLEISSIRALRFLIAKEWDTNPWECQIHTVVPLHEHADHQWFLNTTSGLASVLGGTSSIRFSTAEGNPRISRNTGNLIREESGISEYSDQCGGAYYIEVLTHKIIEACTGQMK